MDSLFPVVRFLLSGRQTGGACFFGNIAMPDKVIVFLDVQNTYRGARDAFFIPSDHHTFGQFSPIALANYLVSHGPHGSDRMLLEVRAYTGRPDSTKDPKSYGAHMKQCAAWQKEGVKVIPRSLRYPLNWPREKAQEKGIDVMLAIDFVTMAMNDEYDIGVMVSGDTDLRPALEYVASLTDPVRTIEVAAWRSPKVRRRLAIKFRNVWCHWLDQTVYASMADQTNYAK